MGMFNTLPGWFLRTPAGQEALQQAQEAHEATREELAAEITAIREEKHRAAPAARERLEKARTRHAEAAAALREATAELTAAEQAWTALSNSAEARVDALKAQLRLAADPAIAAFQEWCLEERERVRNLRPEVTEFGERNFVTRTRNRASNLPSIVARVEGLGAAYRAAEALKLEVGVDVQERLEEIRVEIPKVRPVQDFIPDGARIVQPQVPPEAKPPEQPWVDVP